MANFRKWSTTATGNATVAGGLNTINWAEGQSPGSVNNSAREMMAQLRSIYTGGEWGWVEFSGTASVASQTTVKIAGNQTSLWVGNRRVRFTGGSAQRFATIVSSSFTTETTITVSVDSGSLSASMSILSISAVGQNNIPRDFVTSNSLSAALATYLTSNSLSAAKATAAQYRANTADRILVTDQVWSAGGRVAVTWNAGGTTTVDMSTGINFTITTSVANSTLGAPTNAKTGQSGFIEITQDGTTARSLTFASAWQFAGGTDPTLTATPSAKDILFYQVLNSTGPIVFGNLVKNVS